jgi:hypothetical protein
MAFSGIRTLRKRMAATLAVLLVPLVLIVGVNVVITYSKVKGAVEALPATAASVSMQALHATLVGAARYSIAVGDSFRNGAVAANYLDQTLSHNPGYSAIAVTQAGASALAVRPEDSHLTGEIAAALNYAESGEPQLPSAMLPARVWFRPVSVGDKRLFAVRAEFIEDAPAATRVDVLLSNELFRHVLNSIDDHVGAQVTLVDSRLRPLSSDADENWTPADGFPIATATDSTPGRGRDGVRRVYSVKPLAGPHAYVVAALDDATAVGLTRQIPAAVIVPVLALAAITFAFLRALKSNVVDWIYALDSDVRRSTANDGARAIVSARMPIEIENVARSFNAVLDAHAAREADLSNALVHNRALTRELHHRVKNSLQMVQSYLALGARDAQPAARAVLATAQCRTYILSSAYRRALAEGEMRPFDIDPFLADVGAYAAEVLRQPGQSVERVFQAPSHAGIDAAIPLGMIVVELIERGLAIPGARVVNVSLSTTHEGRAQILASTDVAADFPRPGRLLVSLLRQIGADAATQGAGGRFSVIFDIETPQTNAHADPTHACGGASQTMTNTSAP